jgi:hypothetical protein
MCDRPLSLASAAQRPAGLTATQRPATTGCLLFEGVIPVRTGGGYATLPVGPRWVGWRGMRRSSCHAANSGPMGHSVALHACNRHLLSGLLTTPVRSSCLAGRPYGLALRDAPSGYEATLPDGSYRRETTGKRGVSESRGFLSARFYHPMLGLAW